MMSSIIFPTWFPRKASVLVLAMLLLVLTAPGLSAQSAGDNSGTQASEITVAPVIVDGTLVLQVRGISSYPANERAQRVRARIIEAATDKSFLIDDLVVTHEADRSIVYAGGKDLVSVFDVDAEIEDLDRNIQDVFNEYGVQIMSPSYEMDPEKPKVVAPENWYAAPATEPE